MPHGEQVFALLAFGPADVGGGVAEEVGHFHAGNGHRPLEGQEQARSGALVGRHGQQVLPVQLDASGRNLVSGMAHDGQAERALTRAVRAHQGMDLAPANGDADSLEDRLVADVDVEIVNRKGVVHSFLPFQSAESFSNPA